MVVRSKNTLRHYLRMTTMSILIQFLTVLSRAFMNNYDDGGVVVEMKMME